MAFASSRPIEGAVATLGVSDRVAFLRKTYAHLGVALLAFAAVAGGMMRFMPETSLKFSMWALKGRWNWFIVLALFMVVGGLLVLTTGNWSWMWEVLIGWFLWSAATRSVRIARLKDAVEGVTVREVMTDRVPAIRADQSVRVGLAQESAVPGAGEVAVIERDGRLVGVVNRGALEEAARDRPDAAAGEIAIAPDAAQVILPTASAAELVERLSQLPGRLLLVVRDGALLGTVDPRSLVAALRRAETENPTVLEP